MFVSRLAIFLSWWAAIFLIVNGIVSLIFMALHDSVFLYFQSATISLGITLIISFFSKKFNINIEATENDHVV